MHKMWIQTPAPSPRSPSGRLRPYGKRGRGEDGWEIGAQVAIFWTCDIPCVPRLSPDRRGGRAAFAPSRAHPGAHVITLLALCAGLTAIRLAAEGTIRVGRLCNRIRRRARRHRWAGGAAPQRHLAFRRRVGQPRRLREFRRRAWGGPLYFWSLHEAKGGGLDRGHGVCDRSRLRLARFNVTIDDPNRPSWAANFSSACRRRRAPSRCCCRSTFIFSEFPRRHSWFRSRSSIRLPSRC